AGCPICRSLTQSLSIVPPRLEGGFERETLSKARRNGQLQNPSPRGPGKAGEGFGSEGGGGGSEAVEDREDHEDAAEQEGDEEEALDVDAARADLAEHLLVLRDVAEPPPPRLPDPADLVVRVEEALAKE